MSFPRPDDATKEFFGTILPADPRIQIKPMFGNLASFMNGNMFAGVFGQQVFIRLPEESQALLLQEPGTAIFAPMPDRPMKEYVVLPDAWRQDAEKAQLWAQRSLNWVASMPPKEPKRKK